MGLQRRKAHAVPEAELVHAQGMQSITNLIVRRRFGADGADGPVVALNAHGDVVPPGRGLEPWTLMAAPMAEGKPLWPRGGREQERLLATYTFALRALEALQA